MEELSRPAGTARGQRSGTRNVACHIASMDSSELSGCTNLRHSYLSRMYAIFWGMVDVGRGLELCGPSGALHASQAYQLTKVNCLMKYVSLSRCPLLKHHSDTRYSCPKLLLSDACNLRDKCSHLSQRQQFAQLSEISIVGSKTTGTDTKRSNSFCHLRLVDGLTTS
jgi:hypothetical protein